MTDTAGIRQTEDLIEKIGIEKSKVSFQKADLVLFLLDSSRPLDEEDEEIIKYVENKNIIIILNKSDLKQKITEAEIKEKMPNVFVVKASIKEGIGVDIIENKIESLVYKGEVKQNDSLMVTLSLIHIWIICF